MTTERIAELEAEVMRLREALRKAAHMVRENILCPEGNPYAVQDMEALADKKFTPTALNELVEKVERRTIERCAQMFSYSGIGGRYLADQVRTISTGQIKLKELL